ncbi:MAG: DUF3782 domain-containing protein [Candidatus Kapabacteria bacterium]|nr:DUF3782 domain-containing protein [Candidatus Kapabacteria bacterium]
MQEKTLTYEQLINLFQEDRKQFQEIKEAQLKTDKQIKELGIQIGGLGNRFGQFTEDLFYNSLSKIMKEKFGVQFFEPNRSREKGDASIEIDAMGIVNGSINAVYLTEIKSKYNKKAIEQLTVIIKKFDSFYPELSDKKKFGIIAVPHLNENQANEILKAGFYPATLKNDLVVIDTPKNFKPKEF